ncbi:MAG TPA: type 1 glutamine amidotransferase domain-containing protein [Dyella sp.]|uniref:type 1 glutamine amidotransferase domain-containing protein n=1 Tax=Dyella sp. TaxID=1869338 RepID=UPI002D15D418|nr:type 1 glutamine amidotransferase domain-containing protein [Dyella sp.]HTV85342.1 type 1 glutamine amidotransferase domain-containing protein [Dyella sp.]
MATVLIPLPHRDYDPSEVAVPWRVLTQARHRVVFATPDGGMAMADPIMLSGEGLDLWGWIPGLRKIPLIGLLLRANHDARRDHAALVTDAAFGAPLRWDALHAGAFDGLLLPGGHCARGMRSYLESKLLKNLVAEFFAADKPVAAICHGVLLAARSQRSDGRSVLYGRRTTGLTWALEKSAWSLTRITRFWDPDYYRTYRETSDQPAGYMSVQQEVSRVLADPADFLDVPKGAPQYGRKASGLVRDSDADDTPAFIVRDGHYLSARWPGDVHRFAREFAAMLPA